MKQSRTQNTKSTKYSWPTILLAMAASVSTASADVMPQKYMIAGVYPTRSNTARTASKIDLDQAEIERLLALDLLNNDKEDTTFLDQARRVYEHGMNSGSYAALTLTKNADHKIDLPDRIESIYYNSIDYDPKQHSVYELSVAGMNEAFDKHIKGTYRTTSDNLSILTLNVFYPEDSKCDHGHTDECFAKEGGIVLEGYGALDYKYNPSTDNYYSSSLKWYAQDEAMRMYYCEEHGNCSKYTQYEHMFSFYGLLDYGNEWIESAFLNKKTQFPRTFKTSHGYEDVDFGHFSELGRNVFIQTATVSLNVFTQINRLMIEFGLDGCKKNSKDFSSYGNHLSKDSIIASWDQAAALYAGSALIAPEGSTTDSTKTGSLYYHMVDTLAKEFGAMKVDETTNQPISIVNQEVMDAFATGKVALEQSDCEIGVRSSYFTITNHMKTPWIQGILKATFEYSNYHYDNIQDREEQGGKAAAYMAALLPNLYECSPEAADIVMEELAIMWPHGNTQKLRPDFQRVRNALEHQYQCFGITCDEVGGFINPETGDYFEETRPCGGYGTMLTQRRDSVDYSHHESVHSFSSEFSSTSSLSDKKSLVMSSFFVALGLFFVTLAALVVTVRDRSRTNFATRLVSGAMSQADYWLSQQRGEQGYTAVNNDYEVQLRPMSRLQPGEESLI